MFVSVIAFLLEGFLSANVERSRLGPIEKPSEAVRFRKQGFGICRDLRVARQVCDAWRLVRFSRDVQPDVPGGNQNEHYKSY